ncbi:MAG: DUF1731 domain-containing protein [Terrimonas sp.]|nr:DUF1731 domain-containing protein [Terrimonas sp.]
MKNKKIIITGGTGFIGQALVKYLGNENEIIILSRQQGDPHNNAYHSKLLTRKDGYKVQYLKWDGCHVDNNWLKAIDRSDILLNLAGKSVNCRYHKKQKNEILSSRVNATKTIGEAIRKCNHPPQLWINGGSTTIYRNEYEGPNDEFTGMISDQKKDNMPFNFLDTAREIKNRILTRVQHGKNSSVYKELDYDFSVQVCKLWEKTFEKEQTAATRKVILRTAITLDEGGVLTPYLRLCKYFLGGKQGSGKQMFSWVHAEDIARMIEWLFENKTAEGVYNCVAPYAVSNTDLMYTLRNITHNKIGLPAPELLLEAGAFLIGTETELLLKSRWVIPAKARKEGFRFKYETIGQACQAIIGKLPRSAYRLL